MAMSRVLIIKTSSLGDVVHNLPIIHDILAAQPDALIDWVVEEAYADLPRMHPGVMRVIPVAQRRWRRSLSAAVAEERQAFEETLRKEEYDVVLDTQGLLKSGLLARLARLAPGGIRVGFSRKLARESLARLFYDRGFDVGSHLHAVERVRSLASQALGYPLQGPPQFDLRVEHRDFDWLGRHPFVALIHATSRPEKGWPAPNWRAIVDTLYEVGLHSVLPHGTERERQDAIRIADAAPGAIVAPRLRLAEMAALLSQAQAVVGVDTGLTHLASALDVPTVALFGATPKWRYAPYWSKAVLSLGENRQQPSSTEVVEALEQLEVLRHA
jgi:heptosyltransferase-1